MNYQETLDFMFSQLPMYQRKGKAAYKANLDNTLALDSYFNHPHRDYKCIHVAGTNGKGSTSHMLSAILQKAGYKVGLYTSPHLRDFRERIKVNGQMMPEENVIKFVEDHQNMIKELKPSFFEMTVALAFDYFRHAEIDVAIVEVGLGGRLDSTNIIDADLSIITNIGLDHTDLLGDTYEKIAIEKAGIIKSTTPVIIGETHPETQEIFQSRAKEFNAEIQFADQEIKIDYALQSAETLQSFTAENSQGEKLGTYELDLLGNYQIKNVKTALLAAKKLRSLNYKITESHIQEGLKDASKISGLLGRWQVLNQNPLAVCDTGHNEDGVKSLVKQIQNTAYKNLYIVIGMVNDKNIDTVLGLLPKEAQYIFTQASIPRALDAEILQEKAQEKGLKGEIIRSVPEAYSHAISKAEAEDFVFIGGSTFVVAEIV